MLFRLMVDRLSQIAAANAPPIGSNRHSHNAAIIRANPSGRR